MIWTVVPTSPESGENDSIEGVDEGVNVAAWAGGLKTISNRGTTLARRNLSPPRPEASVRWKATSSPRERRGAVFYGERKGPVRRHTFRKVWQRASTRAGVDVIRVEWLRHSGASLACAATKDMKATAARLGHSSTRMIDTVYLKLYDDVGRQVADAIDELVRASAVRETDH
jgi:integrase